MKEKVIIIIPTFNESLVIEETISQVFDAVQYAENYEVHILVFDSASNDGTQEIVINLQTIFPRLHLKTEPQKTGLGSAYHAAMCYAMETLNADIIVEFDADLSHQPKYLLPMLEKMHCFDVVVGSRYIPGGSIPKSWGWHRKLLSRLGCYTANLFLTMKRKDFTSGFRATRVDILRKILPKQFISKDFAYKLELFYLLHSSNARILELPIDFIDREKGQSKLTANQIYDSLMVIYKIRFGKLNRYLSMSCVGIVGMLLQMTIFNFSRLFLSALPAAKIALTVALINNYLLNNRYTFKDSKHQSSQKTRFCLFITFSVFAFFLQIELLKLATYISGGGFWQENLLVFLGILLGSIFNYLAYSKVVWKNTSLTT